MDKCECKCDCKRDWFLFSRRRGIRMCSPCVGASAGNTNHTQPKEGSS